MRAHVIVSTLCAVGLFGGVALAEHPDHATRERPTREHIVREHSVREVRAPEHVDRARAHGDVEHVRSGSSRQHVERVTSDKSKQKLESRSNAKFADRGNCSGVADECKASRSQSSARSDTRGGRFVGFTGPNSGWYAQQREKMREKYLEAVMQAKARAKEGLEGK